MVWAHHVWSFFESTNGKGSTLPDLRTMVIQYIKTYKFLGDELDKGSFVGIQWDSYTSTMVRISHMCWFNPIVVCDKRRVQKAKMWCFFFGKKKGSDWTIPILGGKIHMSEPIQPCTSSIFTADFSVLLLKPEWMGKHAFLMSPRGDPEDSIGFLEVTYIIPKCHQHRKCFCALTRKLKKRTQVSICSQSQLSLLPSFCLGDQFSRKLLQSEHM